MNMEAHPGSSATPPAVTCPYCRSTNTELFSMFGQQLLTEQYYCNNCRTPFEYIKDAVHVIPERTNT
jgi:DNA-directed RNA polymerase subunit RPC12/RpoP